MNTSQRYQEEVTTVKWKRNGSDYHYTQINGTWYAVEKREGNPEPYIVMRDGIRITAEKTLSEAKRQAILDARTAH